MLLGLVLFESCHPLVVPLVNRFQVTTLNNEAATLGINAGEPVVNSVVNAKGFSMVYICGCLLNPVDKLSVEATHPPCLPAQARRSAGVWLYLSRGLANTEGAAFGVP